MSFLRGCSVWVFPEIGVPQNGWFTMENPIKIHDLGVPLFLETPIYIYTISGDTHLTLYVSIPTATMV